MVFDVNPGDEHNRFCVEIKIYPMHTHLITQKIFFRISEGETGDVKHVRNFLNIVSERSDMLKAFFVSNVVLGEESQEEFKGSNDKRVCVCLYYEIINKIIEYTEKFKEFSG